ncbi:hypothetical protein [Blautia sp. Marseille-P3087]|uniref:hypothetical protein n=1 Tax=Blautia sp. Marseille-P3087 TaxID=1917876 RepID=UPI0013566CEB|nr:hypothetical protein [Blautia sp. Marseille-P3087]
MIDSVSNIKDQVLNNVEQIVPDPDEQTAMDAYKNGNPDYQPSVSQEDLLKELNLKHSL